MDGSLSQKNEIAKKGKNVVMTSKTHYFVSLLLLLPYLEELKKSSSTLQAANPVHLKVLLFHTQCWHIWCPSLGGYTCSLYSLKLKNFNEANCTLWNNYFASLLLLLPKNWKRASLQAANPVHLKVLLFHVQCWHIWCPSVHSSVRENLSRSTH